MIASILASLILAMTTSITKDAIGTKYTVVDYFGRKFVTHDRNEYDLAVKQIKRFGDLGGRKRTMFVTSEEDLIYERVEREYKIMHGRNITNETVQAEMSHDYHSRVSAMYEGRRAAQEFLEELEIQRQEEATRREYERREWERDIREGMILNTLMEIRDRL